MAVKELKCRIRGLVPLILHNGRLKNPRDKMAKQIKEYTSKRKKTDADFEEISRLEWFAGLYTDDEGNVVIPGTNIEGMVVSGAKKAKRGKDFQAGVFCDENPVIEHDGPKDLNELWMDERFVMETAVKVKSTGGSVMRTRPIFREWSLNFKLTYSDDVVNEADVKKALEDAGRLVGLCDWRPKFGRFEIVSCK